MPKLKRPVIAGWEQEEHVVEGGSSFESMSVLRHRELGCVSARWELTEKDRADIAAGADVYVSIICGNGKVQPHRVMVLNADDEKNHLNRYRAAALLLGYNPDTDLCCEVCHNRSLVVAASPVGPSSHAICYSCLVNYRLPWGELLASMIGVVNMDCTPQAKKYIDATCAHYHKTTAEFWADVEEFSRSYRESQGENAVPN